MCSGSGRPSRLLLLSTEGATDPDAYVDIVGRPADAVAAWPRASGRRHDMGADVGTTVVAIGGNSLIHDAGHQEVEDQYQALLETMRAVLGCSTRATGS